MRKSDWMPSLPSYEKNAKKNASVKKVLKSNLQINYRRSNVHVVMDVSANPFTTFGVIDRL